MTATTALHRPRIERHQEETTEGLAWCYRLACSCGEEFDEHYAKSRAAADRDAHLSEVAPPDDERCRQPKAHKTRSWDHCPLCADQLPLFDL